MTDLKDKVAIVTGASAGIGAATVKALLAEGMKVVGLARRKEKIEELGKGYEGKLFALKVDISNEKEISEALSWTEKNVGPLFVLINNAGVLSMKSIDEVATEVFKTVLDTNLFGLTVLTKDAIKSFKANNIDGNIINVNSVCGHYISGWNGLAIYHASKYGVTAFTEAIRIELAKSGSKIRIASVSPGIVESEMSATYVHNYPHIKSEDVANTILFILKQPSNVQIAELTIRPTGEII